MCEQAVDSRAFEGGCNGRNNCRFKACKCKRVVSPPECGGPTADPGNFLEKRCLDSAANACLDPLDGGPGDTIEEQEKLK